MPLWRPGFLERARRATGRLPPGQREVRGWPVLHEGNPPTVDLDAWRLRVWGEVEQPISLDWEALHALSPFETSQDFHCVTSW
ncbi:MAG: molybdopterin-dependent oxidoreductase, partial [Myxococcota bacterium]|nr:molybdopterin-dependent oxidoreductase [Myxococcota bacterium]